MQQMKKCFQPVSLTRNGGDLLARSVGISIYQHLLNSHEQLKKRDELYDVDLAREEKAMKENIEKRQLKQRALLEQYEITMKNDLLWNEFIENINKLPIHHFPEQYDLKELVHFYFAKSSSHHPQQQPQPTLAIGTISGLDPNSHQQQVKIQMLCEFLTDLLTKEHAFPYEAIQQILSYLSHLVSALDKSHLIYQSQQFNKLLKSAEEMLHQIILYERNCQEISKQCDQILTKPHQTSNSLQDMKNRIEQLLATPRYQPFLQSELFTNLQNCLLNLQERIDLQTTHNKELSNQQYLIRKYFPYILTQKQLIQSYQQFTSAKPNIGPVNEMLLRFKEILINAMPILEHRLSSSLSAAPASNANTTNGVSAVYPVDWIVNDIILKLSDLLTQMMTINHQLFSIIVAELLDTVRGILMDGNNKLTKEAIQLYSMIIFGIYHELKNSSQRKQFQKTLLLHFGNYDICIPNFLLPTVAPNNVNITEVRKKNESALLWMSFLLLYSNDNSSEYYENEVGIGGTSSPRSSNESQTRGPLHLTFGYQYLLHSTHQLYYLQYYLSANTNSAGSNFHLPAIIRNAYPPSEICYYLFLFLKYSSYIYWTKYQKKFEQLLQQLLRIVEIVLQNQQKAKSNEGYLADIQNLQQYLLEIVEKKIQSPSFYNYQSSYIIHSTIALSKMKSFADEIQEMEKNKQSAFMIFVKKYEIDRIRLIFNRLGATAESHKLAFTALLEKIALISQIGTNNNTSTRPPDLTGILNNSMALSSLHPTDQEKQLLLRYLLYKIVINIFKDCQEEFFSELDEQQVLRLARIICLLCQEISELITIFRDYFYLVCPLLIPKIVPEMIAPITSNAIVSKEKLQENALLSLGFTRKLKKDSDKDYIYEKDEKWRSRMCKIVSVFALISVQSEQVSSFTIHDIWKYLVRLTNDCSQLGPSIASMEYILSIYEIVLKITAPFLFSSPYQAYFFQLLQIIQQKILIHFSNEKHPKKAFVEVFINTFLQSQGRECIRLFVVSNKEAE